MDWYVCTMDEGQVGRYPSRRAAVVALPLCGIIRRHTYYPGFYDYTSADSGHSYSVGTLRGLSIQGYTLDPTKPYGWDWDAHRDD